MPTYFTCRVCFSEYQVGKTTFGHEILFKIIARSCAHSIYIYIYICIYTLSMLPVEWNTTPAFVNNESNVPCCSTVCCDCIVNVGIVVVVNEIKSKNRQFKMVIKSNWNSVSHVDMGRWSQHSHSIKTNICTVLWCNGTICFVTVGHLYFVRCNNELF